MKRPDYSPFIALHSETCRQFLTTDQDSAYNVLMAIFTLYYDNSEEGDQVELPPLTKREKILFNSAIERIESERNKYFKQNNSIANARKHIGRKKASNDTETSIETVTETIIDTGIDTTTDTTLLQEQTKTKPKTKSKTKDIVSSIQSNNYSNAPTLEQVDKYIKSKNYIFVDPCGFFDTMQGQHWTYNGEPIRHWKMLIDSWEHSLAKNNKPSEHMGSFDTDEFFEAALQHRESQ